MAIALTVGAAQDIDAATSHVWSFDAGADARAVVVAICQSTTSNTSSVDYGGRTLTKWASGYWSVGGHNAGEVWGYIGDDVPSGSNDMTVVTSSAAPRSAVPYGIAASGPIVKHATYELSTASGRVRFTMDSGSYPGRGIIAGSIKQGGAGDTPVAGTTEDKDRFDGTDSNMVIGHEAADSTGSRAVGFTNVWLCGAAGVMLAEQDIDITPDPWGMGLGFRAGTVTRGADLAIPAARMRALALGFRAGRVSAVAPRQVLLTGNDLETPEMTTGNVEGTVLTQHADRGPTWEEPGGSVTAAAVKALGRWEPVVHDPGTGPELVFHDGDVVVVWVATP